MRKNFIVAVIVIVALALSLTAFAVPSGKTVVLEPKGAGKVVFDGKMHADKGFKCADCHPGVFMMKKDGDKITMKDIREGKFCGTCHNGTKAQCQGCGELHKVPQELNCPHTPADTLMVRHEGFFWGKAGHGRLRGLRDIRRSGRAHQPRQG